MDGLRRSPVCIVWCVSHLLIVSHVVIPVLRVFGAIRMLMRTSILKCWMRMYVLIHSVPVEQVGSMSTLQIVLCGLRIIQRELLCSVRMNAHNIKTEQQLGICYARDCMRWSSRSGKKRPMPPLKAKLKSAGGIKFVLMCFNLIRWLRILERG